MISPAPATPPRAPVPIPTVRSPLPPFIWGFAAHRRRVLAMTMLFAHCCQRTADSLLVAARFFDEALIFPLDPSCGTPLVRNRQGPAMTDLAPHTDGTVFGVGLELTAGELTVDGLTPGCSAEKSSSVMVGDEIIAVDGAENLTVQHAKQLMLGRCEPPPGRGGLWCIACSCACAGPGCMSFAEPKAKRIALGSKTENSFSCEAKGFPILIFSSALCVQPGLLCHRHLPPRGGQLHALLQGNAKCTSTGQAKIRR